MELVNLFKELMKRGWKVYGEYDELMSYGQTRGKRDFGFGVLGEIKYSLRELVSKESGLWQFVCENKLVETDDDYSREKYRYNHGMKKEYKSRVIKGEARKYQVDYEYRIIESALCDEDKLEQFLIDNIEI